MAIDIYSFVTLNDVKNFIGMSGTDVTTDTLLEDIINSVSSLFETYTNRKFKSRDYTEYYNGMDKSLLFTNQYPISSVLGIWDDSEWIWDDNTEIDSSKYRVVNEYIIFKDVILRNYNENIKITYTAGFTSIPYDLKQACISESARIYKNRKQVDVVSKTLADGSVSFSAKDLMAQNKLILNGYIKRDIL